MTLQKKIETLIEAIAALPDKGQAEILQSLVESQGRHLGIDDLDDDEYAAVAHRAEAEGRSRFAARAEIDATFAGRS